MSSGEPQQTIQVQNKLFNLLLRCNFAQNDSAPKCTKSPIALTFIIPNYVLVLTKYHNNTRLNRLIRYTFALLEWSLFITNFKKNCQHEIYFPVHYTRTEIMVTLCLESVRVLCSVVKNNFQTMAMLINSINSNKSLSRN